MAEIVGSENPAPVELEGKPQPDSHKLWLALLLVGALAAALFLGIYLGRSYFAPKLLLPSASAVPTSALVQSPTQAPVPTLALTPDSTIGWKKHSNNEFNFSFRFPESLKLSEAKKCLYLSELTSRLPERVERCENPEIAPISIYFATTPFNGFNIGDGSTFTESKSQEQIGGVTATKQVVRKITQAPGPDYAVYLTFSSGDAYFQISLMDRQYEAKLAQILSTFQFLD